jgi:hypothetical protein
MADCYPQVLPAPRAARPRRVSGIQPGLYLPNLPDICSERPFCGVPETIYQRRISAKRAAFGDQDCANESSLFVRPFKDKLRFERIFRRGHGIKGV